MIVFQAVLPFCLLVHGWVSGQWFLLVHDWGSGQYGFLLVHGWGSGQYGFLLVHGWGSGQYGFLLPETQIIPSGEETIETIKVCCAAPLGNRCVLTSLLYYLVTLTNLLPTDATKQLTNLLPTDCCTKQVMVKFIVQQHKKDHASNVTVVG